MRRARAGFRWFSHGYVLLVMWAACANPVLAQGRAARFQGVERWLATATNHISVQIQGRGKERNDTNRFKLERHQVQGTVETWEGTAKVKGSDHDENLMMSGSISGEATSDYRLEIDANSDDAVLHIHVRSSKSTLQASMFGRQVQQMSLDQPTPDFDLRAAISDDAESLEFRRESHNDLLVGRIDSVSVLTLVPDEVPLTAVLVAGSAVRGERARLDGSRSRGRINTYSWRLTPLGDSHAPVTEFDTTTPVVDLVLLEDVKVHLRVADSRGRRKEATDATAKVIARKQWDTLYDPDPVEGALRDQGLVSPEAVPGETNHFGQNTCAKEGQDSGHGIHASSTTTWHDEPDGFTLARVTDPGRPFHQYWYVATQALVAKRKVFLNPDLLEGSPLFDVNRQKGTIAAFRTLVASSRAHERMHGTLIQKIVLAENPSKRIEALVSSSEDGLVTFADMAIRATQTNIQEGDFHEQDVRRAMAKDFAGGGTVWVRNGGGGFAPWTIASFANKGE